MGLNRRDGSFLASARLSNPTTGNLEYGASALMGNVLTSHGMRTIPAPGFAARSTPKRRAGVDVQYLTGPFTLRGEASFGRNDTKTVGGILFGTDYRVPSRRELTVTAQGQFWSDNLDDSQNAFVGAGLGAAYQLTQSWSLRAAVFYDFHRPDDMTETQVYAQLYYFGR